VVLDDRPARQPLPPAEFGQPRTARPAKPRRRRRVRAWLWAGAAVLAVAAAAAGVKTFLLHGRGPAHVLVIPSKLGDFVRMPNLEHQMNITRLRQQVIAKSGGQATHVVSAVYQNSAGGLGAAQQELILFIGGN